MAIYSSPPTKPLCSILQVLAGRLGHGFLGLLLAILAGSHILRSDGLFVRGLNSLAVDTFNIRMGRSNASAQVLLPTLSRLLDVIALLVDDTCFGLILGLELNLALQGLDFLRVEEVTVLVTVFNLLLLGNYSVFNLRLFWGWRSS
ncbi:hypothetical protein HG530_001858 [Fusarium avenaceum]|nr:hypothetical protein HG530_001858 [Fusarium avenaceum]